MLTKKPILGRLTQMVRDIDECKGKSNCRRYHVIAFPVLITLHHSWSYPASAHLVSGTEPWEKERAPYSTLNTICTVHCTLYAGGCCNLRPPRNIDWMVTFPWPLLILRTPVIPIIYQSLVEYHSCTQLVFKAYRGMEMNIIHTYPWKIVLLGGGIGKSSCK
jgi:hypothetical protein